MGIYLIPLNLRGLIMSVNKEELEINIKVLCDQFIDILDELKDDGIITREEYEEHAYLKRKFLKEIDFI